MNKGKVSRAASELARARAEKLTAEERSDIARRAVAVRWTRFRRRRRAEAEAEKGEQ
jgi:hypothetical protein